MLQALRVCDSLFYTCRTCPPIDILLISGVGDIFLFAAGLLYKCLHVIIRAYMQTSPRCSAPVSSGYYTSTNLQGEGSCNVLSEIMPLSSLFTRPPIDNPVRPVTRPKNSGIGSS